MMSLYAFTRPNAMEGHEYTDDAALTYALNKKQAVEKFSEYYADVKPKEVRKVDFINGIFILTDY